MAKRRHGARPAGWGRTPGTSSPRRIARTSEVAGASETYGTGLEVGRDSTIQVSQGLGLPRTCPKVSTAQEAADFAFQVVQSLRDAGLVD